MREEKEFLKSPSGGKEGSSLSLVLPKSWCDIEKITNKTQLRLIPHQHTLSIVRSDFKSAPLEFEVDLDNLEFKTENYLKQIYVGVYISGYSIITFKTKYEKIDNKFLKAIEWGRNHSGFTQKKMPDSTKESNKISIAFIDPSPRELNPIKNMHENINRMVDNLCKALRKNDGESLKQICEKEDDDIDLNHRFMVRLTSQTLNNNLFHLKENSPSLMMQHYLVSRSLEKLVMIL